MPEKEIKTHLEARLTDIAKILLKGKDVEVRRDPQTVVKVISVDKKVIANENNIPRCGRGAEF